MRIAIVNPPSPPGTTSNKDTMGGLGQLLPAESPSAFPPLEIPSAAGLLRANGHDVAVVDSLGDHLDTEALTTRLKPASPDLVALRTSTPTVDWDLEVAARLKQELGTKILVFGPHVTLFPEPVIAGEAVDAIILGEAELPLLELAGRSDFGDCRGVWWKADGEIVRNERAAAIEDLDVLPFPAWDLMPYRAYDGGELMRGLRPFVPVETSRGCPFKCAYCPYPVVQGNAMRCHSAARVVEGLAWLSEDLGVKSVLFRDPEFAHKKDRVFEMCEGIVERGVKIAWRCETRMENITDELVAAMARAGCIGINFGVESADVTVLKNVKRKVMPLEKAQRAIEACHRHGIDTFCFFILGLPGETTDTALQTIRYALALNPELAQFTVATPYPGTELRRWAEGKGFIEAAALTSYDPAMRNDDMDLEELARIKRFANEAWENRSATMMKRIFHKPFRAPRIIRRTLSVQRRLAVKS